MSSRAARTWLHETVQRLLRAARTAASRRRPGAGARTIHLRAHEARRGPRRGRRQRDPAARGARRGPAHFRARPAAGRNHAPPPAPHRGGCRRTSAPHRRNARPTGGDFPAANLMAGRSAENRRRTIPRSGDVHGPPPVSLVRAQMPRKATHPQEHTDRLCGGLRPTAAPGRAGARHERDGHGDGPVHEPMSARTRTQRQRCRKLSAVCGQCRFD